MPHITFSSYDREILRLAVPSIVSNITVPLLGLVDLAIVGHMGAMAYIGAVAVGTMIFNVLYWVFGFLRMGTSGITAQACGRNDREGEAKVLWQSMSVAMTIALSFIVLQVPLRHAALAVMHPSAAVGPLATAYFNICIWGAPAVLGLNSLTGWYVGMQNTRIPMAVAIAQNIVNIVVSLALVFGLGLKIEGVALGTVVAQWSGFGATLLLWRRSYGKRFPRSLFRRVTGRLHQPAASGDSPHGEDNGEQDGWRRFFNVNRDIFFRTLALVAVNLFFTAAGAREGDLLLSVNTMLMTFFTLYSYVMDGFAFAGEALSGRYTGAADRRSFTAVTKRLFSWGGSVTAAFTLLYIIGGKGFLSLLTNEAAVVDAAAAYWPWACLIPMAGGAAFVCDGIFIGMTATRDMLLSTLSAATAFFAVFFVFVPRLHNHALWLAFLVFLAVRGAVLLWRMKKSAQAPAARG